MIVKRAPLFKDDGAPNTDEITEDDRAHSQWYDRNTIRPNKSGNQFEQKR